MWRVSEVTTWHISLTYSRPSPPVECSISVILRLPKLRSRKTTAGPPNFLCRFFRAIGASVVSVVSCMTPNVIRCHLTRRCITPSILLAVPLNFLLQSPDACTAAPSPIQHRFAQCPISNATPSTAQQNIPHYYVAQRQ